MYCCALFRLKRIYFARLSTNRFPSRAPHWSVFSRCSRAQWVFCMYILKLNFPGQRRVLPLVIYNWVILMSIVPFDRQKWLCLLLSSCSVKLLKINTKISVSHALLILLKSGFCLYRLRETLKINYFFDLFCIFLWCFQIGCFSFGLFFSLKQKI